MSFRSTTRTTIPNANFIPTLSKEKMIINETLPVPVSVPNKQEAETKSQKNRKQRTKTENRKQKTKKPIHYVLSQRTGRKRQSTAPSRIFNYTATAASLLERMVAATPLVSSPERRSSLSTARTRSTIRASMPCSTCNYTQV